MNKIILIAMIMMLFTGCRNKTELTMERGEYFYNAGRLEEAILEYNKVINHYPSDASLLDYQKVKMLANAHHNLAVILFKRGYESEDSIEKMSYLGKASAEAKRSYDLYPKDVYKETWDKVQKAMKE